LAPGAITRGMAVDGEALAPDDELAGAMHELLAPTRRPRRIAALRLTGHHVAAREERRDCGLQQVERRGAVGALVAQADFPARLGKRKDQVGLGRVCGDRHGHPRFLGRGPRMIRLMSRAISRGAFGPAGRSHLYVQLHMPRTVKVAIPGSMSRLPVSASASTTIWLNRER